MIQLTILFKIQYNTSCTETTQRATQKNSDVLNGRHGSDRPLQEKDRLMRMKPYSSRDDATE